MSSSNTEENRSQPCTNQPCVIGYPVEPSGYVIVGVPVVQTSARAPDSAIDINNNNAGDNRNNLNANRPDADNRSNNVSRNRARVPGNNNNNYVIDDTRDGEESCCRIIITWIIVMLLVVWIDYFSPDKFPQFQIDSMVVSPLNISNSQGAAEWNVGITASNTNKHISIAYKRFELYVFHQMDPYICKTTIAPFHQGHKNQTELIAKAQGNLRGLGGDSIGAVIAKNKDGIVNLDLELVIQVRYLHWIFRPGSTKKLVCMGVKVKFSPNATEGIMLGGPTECNH